MKATVTRFVPERAGVFQNGVLQAFDLVPEGLDSDLVYHWVRVAANARTAPEENKVAKTFLFFAGEAKIKVGGEVITTKAGDALWLPQGSSHTIENGGLPLEFIVVKRK